MLSGTGFLDCQDLGFETVENVLTVKHWVL
jgi:hypothetical protein